MESFRPDSNHYHLRVTQSTLTARQLHEQIKSVSIKPVKKIQYELLCVSAFEISRKGEEHTHHYIICDMAPKTLRARLQEIIPGSGNRVYSLEKVKNRHTCLSYVIKDGSYHADPELQLLCERAPPFVRSQKNSEDLFKEAYYILKEDYLASDMSDYEFVYKTLGLYSDHKKHIYISHIRALWLGVANQRNKRLDCIYRGRVSGNGRPFRHRLVEEIMRGFFIYDN